jgi:signal transduction histidine kinase
MLAMAQSTNDHRRRKPIASPGTRGPRRLRHWLDSVSTKTLVTIVAVSIVIMAAATMTIVVKGVDRLARVGIDREEWAASEAHVHHISDIATGQFLAVVDIALGNAGGAYTIDHRDLQPHVESLIAGAVAIAGGDAFEGKDVALRQSVADFERSLATAEQSDPAELMGPTGSLARLERSFSGLETALGEFSDEMNGIESVRFHDLIDRAGYALLVLVAIFVIAGAGLGLAWALGRRTHSREASLLADISAEKQLIQTVIDALPETIGWKDTSSRLQGMNTALRRRMERQGIQLTVGRRVSEAGLTGAMADYVAAVEDLERQVMTTGEALTNLQMQRPEPNGKPRDVLHTAIPLRRGEEIVGVLATTRDISEVVELERSLAAARRLETIGQLSAGVAHEINTPVQYVSDNCAFLETSFDTVLHALRSLSERLEAYDPEAVTAISKEADLDFLLGEIPDAMHQSRQGLDQIAHIVRAMKAFAHPGGEIGPADINKLITTTADISRNEWKYHATLELDLAEDLPQPRCDEGQIKQVLLNMIINAADAIADAGEDRGVIRITTKPGPDEVVIQIADTGTGIASEVREHIFERFFTTKPVGRGSGQGLAICYDAVSAHGGTIDVDSIIGAGTTFTITLPLRPQGDSRQPDEAGGDDVTRQEVYSA